MLLRLGTQADHHVGLPQAGAGSTTQGRAYCPEHESNQEAVTRVREDLDNKETGVLSAFLTKQSGQLGGKRGQAKLSKLKQHKANAELIAKCWILESFLPGVRIGSRGCPVTKPRSGNPETGLGWGRGRSGKAASQAVLKPALTQAVKMTNT